MKNFLPVLLVTGLLLAGCGEQNAPKATDAQIEQAPRFTGLYIEHIDPKHAVFQTEEGERIVTVPNELRSFFGTIQQGDPIVVHYEKNELNELLLMKATKLEIGGGETVTADPTNEKAEPDEPVEAERTTSELGYTAIVPEGFTLYHEQGIDYVVENGGRPFLQIEALPADTEIRVARWHAAEELQKMGEFFELKGDKRPHAFFESAEFVFAVQNDTAEKTIVVQQIGGQLCHFMFEFSRDVSEETKKNVWAFLASIK